jgi:hypothetical protein
MGAYVGLRRAIVVSLGCLPFANRYGMYFSAFMIMLIEISRSYKRALLVALMRSHGEELILRASEEIGNRKSEIGTFKRG